jgi:hypothetical protein
MPVATRYQRRGQQNKGRARAVWQMRSQSRMVSPLPRVSKASQRILRIQKQKYFLGGPGHAPVNRYHIRKTECRWVGAGRRLSVAVACSGGCPGTWRGGPRKGDPRIPLALPQAHSHLPRLPGPEPAGSTWYLHKRRSGKVHARFTSLSLLPRPASRLRISPNAGQISSRLVHVLKRGRVVAVDTSIRRRPSLWQVNDD